MLIFATLFLLVATSMACPSKCKCVGTEVDCSDSGLSKFPDDVPYNVTKLAMRNNNISALDYDQLRQFVKLEELDLAYNALRELESYIFEGLSSLRVLRLDHNLLNFDVAESRYVFGAMYMLEYLSLSHNQMHSEVTVKSFKTIKRLQYLDVSHNPITALRSGGLPRSLMTLNCSSTMISSVSNSAFYLPKNLIILDLSDIQVPTPSETSTFFYYLSSLRHLRFGSNNTKSLSDAFLKGLGALETLEISGTRVELLPEKMLLATPKLLELNLSGNSLEFFDLDLSANSKLTKIYLDNNRFSTVNMKNAPNLTYLSLASNNFISYPRDLVTSLPTLRSISLSFNSISEINNAGLSPHVATVNLSSNPLVTMASNAFENYTNLVTLDLSATKLTVALTPGSSTKVIITCNCSSASALKGNVMCKDGSSSGTSAKEFLLKCKDEEKPGSKSTGDTNAVIIAVVCVAIILLLIAVVIIVLVKRGGGKEAISKFFRKRGESSIAITAPPTDTNIYLDPNVMNRQSSIANTEHEYGTIGPPSICPYSMASGPGDVNDYALASPDVSTPYMVATDERKKSSAATDHNDSNVNESAGILPPPSGEKKGGVVSGSLSSNFNPYILPDNFPTGKSGWPESGQDANPYLTPLPLKLPSTRSNGYMDFTSNEAYEGGFPVGEYDSFK